MSRIGPGDPRYEEVVEKRFNRRFRAKPEYVELAASTEEVRTAVDGAVRDGRRLAVTSGGHRLEGFVTDPEVRVIVEVSPMKRVYHDAGRKAIAVEAGATVGEVSRTPRWQRWRSPIPTASSGGPHRPQRRELRGGYALLVPLTHRGR